MRCLQVYEDIPKDVWQTISQAGRVQLDTIYTGRNRSWPIDGGLLENSDTESRNLLLTGCVYYVSIAYGLLSTSIELNFFIMNSKMYISYDMESKLI